MLKRLGLSALLLAGCRTTTGPDLDVTGSWTGTWATTVPPGPLQLWAGNLSQVGTVVTGTVNCAATETYTVGGTNLHNSLALTLVGSFGDTAEFTGTASNNGGVQASGHFSDSDGAGCFTGSGDWVGRIP